MYLLTAAAFTYFVSDAFCYQASPERSTRTQQKEFQSNILDGVMEHLLAADVLLGQHKFICFQRSFH